MTLTFYCTYCMNFFKSIATQNIKFIEITEDILAKYSTWMYIWMIWGFFQFHQNKYLSKTIKLMSRMEGATIIILQYYLLSVWVSFHQKPTRKKILTQNASTSLTQKTTRDKYITSNMWLTGPCQAGMGINYFGVWGW